MKWGLQLVCVTYLEIILTLFLEFFLAKVEINTSFQVELHDIIIVVHSNSSLPLEKVNSKLEK